MIKDKHTPGSWFVQHEDTIRTENLESVICKMPGYYRDEAHTLESQANAHLIAAAPELLEALKAAKHWMHWANEKLGFSIDPQFPEWKKTVDAIAKARGES